MAFFFSTPPAGFQRPHGAHAKSAVHGAQLRFRSHGDETQSVERRRETTRAWTSGDRDRGWGGGRLYDCMNSWTSVVRCCWIVPSERSIFLWGFSGFLVPHMWFLTLNPLWAEEVTGRVLQELCEPFQSGRLPMKSDFTAQDPRKLGFPSGKRLHNYGKIHHFSWENPL